MATWIHFLLFFNFALCVLSARSIEIRPNKIYQLLKSSILCQQTRNQCDFTVLPIISAWVCTHFLWVKSSNGKLWIRIHITAQLNGNNILQRGMGLKYLEMRIMELCIRWWRKMGSILVGIKPIGCCKIHGKQYRWTIFWNFVFGFMVIIGRVH